ncbi:hypothetical protein ACFV14_22230 [Streptomyces zaomyceticus]|uniref:hypothetical protein n=1 Tax=Streptomyces zaomyceticus TaxID=68286 RepID=UPI0036922A9B
MDESRKSGARARTAPPRALSPRTAVCGFLLLLALVFAGSYALGAAVGPIGPGARPNPAPASVSPPASAPAPPPNDTSGASVPPAETHAPGHPHGGGHR